MSETHPQEPMHPEVRREHSDANAWAIVVFGLSLAGVLIVVHFLLLWMFGTMERKENRDDPGLPAVATDRPSFPNDLKEIRDRARAPVLQRDAEFDLDQLRRQEEHELTHNGWVDPKAKIVRIPIAEAMHRLETDPRAHGIRFRETPKKESNGGKK